MPRFAVGDAGCSSTSEPVGLSELRKETRVQGQTAIVIAALTGGLVICLLVTRGYAVKPTKVSLPFVDVQLSRFRDLSPVRLFSEVSAVAIRPDHRLASQIDITSGTAPVVMIHIGWNIVCEAFVRRFKNYPDDENLASAAGEIGGQNMEFVQMYREVHSAAIQHSASVTRLFASNYLVRAPSLAQRIEGGSPRIGGGLAESMLAAASETITSGQTASV